MRHDIPSHDQVEKELDSIIDAAQRLRDQWKWAAPSIYSRPRRKGIDINPTAMKRPEPHEMKPGGGHGASAPDPVGDEVAATERFRNKIRHAGSEIFDAGNRLGTALADINDGLLLLDPPPGPEVADVRLRPHPAGERDRMQARAAQARREARAMKTRDYGEITG